MFVRADSRHRGSGDSRAQHCRRERGAPGLWPAGVAKPVECDAGDNGKGHHIAATGIDRECGTPPRRIAASTTPLLAPRYRRCWLPAPERPAGGPSAQGRGRDRELDEPEIRIHLPKRRRETKESRYPALLIASSSTPRVLPAQDLGSRRKVPAHAKNGSASGSGPWFRAANERKSNQIRLRQQLRHLSLRRRLAGRNVVPFRFRICAFLPWR